MTQEQIEAREKRAIKYAGEVIIKLLDTDKAMLHQTVKGCAIISVKESMVWCSSEHYYFLKEVLKQLEE